MNRHFIFNIIYILLKCHPCRSLSHPSDRCHLLVLCLQILNQDLIQEPPGAITLSGIVMPDPEMYQMSQGSTGRHNEGPD